MKINIIGGGPAGMYFAILMKRAHVAHDITIFERNGPDDTFGWGVVFSGKTLANLREADEASHAEIIRDLKAWDNVDVVHRDKKISIHGNSFSGISRLGLLKILQRRCEALGITLNFHTEISELEAQRADCDLFIGADGVNSTVRQTFADEFKPELSVRPNKYIWYGTNQLFHGLTLTFREDNAGVFAAHSYKFDQTTSTFIVECDPETWANAEFAGMSDADTRKYLEEVFANDLKGHPLLSNNSKWINFLLVKNGRWRHENIVLLGDALHTAHFSIGSGTKLAMEDAIALKACFEAESDVPSALERFEQVRRPVIEDYQAAAHESMVWFEHARDYMHLSPIDLAYVLMTRSGKLDLETLRRRDPEFVAAYESSRSECFRAGTKVKTQSGWKKIEDVRRDEFVWTHQNRLRRVVGIQSRPHVGRLVGFRLRSGSRTVWVTPDQHFLSPSPQAERGDVHRQLGGENPFLWGRARELRAEGTAAEQLLWARLRGRKLQGIKFRRQHPLGSNYIADFYAPEVSLAIELDGSAHDSKRAGWADGIRHRQIQHAGVRVLRFKNEKIVHDIDGVLQEIDEFITPSPSGGHGEHTLGFCKVGEFCPGDELIANERGEISTVEAVEFITANETVYDLIIEEDHSFVTEAGVAAQPRSFGKATS